MSEFSGFDDVTAVNIATGLYRRGEIKMGDFTLRSGQWSPIYVDLRPTSSAIENNLNAPNMTKADQLAFRDSVVGGYATMLESFSGEFEHIQAIPEAVCGIAPMVGHVAGQSYLHRRIEQKSHGIKSSFVGEYNEGDRTIFIDDLISTSGAKIDEKILVEDISKTRNVDGEIIGAGLVVQHALILLDRETGGIEAAKKAGLAVHAGITITKALVINNAEGLLDDNSFKIATAFIRGDLTRKEDIPNFI